jgi:hypothetical protein
MARIPRDHVDTSAFGPAQTTPVWGAPFVQAGTGTRQTMATHPPLGATLTGVGSVDPNAGKPPATALLGPSLTSVAAGYGGVAVGGALTGYLASGGKPLGAGIGALVHATLLSFGFAFVGRQRFPTAWTVGFAAAGLAAAAGAGYLFLRARKR